MNDTWLVRTLIRAVARVWSEARLEGSASRLADTAMSPASEPENRPVLTELTWLIRPAARLSSASCSPVRVWSRRVTSAPSAPPVTLVVTSLPFRVIPEIDPGYSVSALRLLDAV